MTEKTYTTKFTTENVNEMLKNEARVYKEATAEERLLLDETLKAAYKEYYPEIEKNDKLFQEIKKSGAEVFFLRLISMQKKMKEDLSIDWMSLKVSRRVMEDSAMQEDKPLKYPDLLTSANDMLFIFDNIIRKADKEFNDALITGEKIEEITMSPLHLAATTFISNEASIEKTSDIASFLKGGANMNALNQICDNSPEVQNMIGTMCAHANTKYAASGLTAGYIHPSAHQASNESTVRNEAISAYIDVNPKTVLALALIAEQRQAIGLPIEKIDSVESLQARCDKADVRDVAKKISYSALDTSLKDATKLAENYAKIEKTSRGISHTA